MEKPEDGQADLCGAAVGAHAKVVHQQVLDGKDQAAGDQSRNDRHKNAGAEVAKLIDVVQRILLFRFFFHDCRTVIGGLPAGNVQEIIESIVDFRSDDDLHLAGLGHNTHYIFNALDGFHVHLGLDCIMDAQPRCAVFDKGDVAQPADLFQDLLGHLCVFAHE